MKELDVDLLKSFFKDISLGSKTLDEVMKQLFVTKMIRNRNEIIFELQESEIDLLREKGFNVSFKNATIPCYISWKEKEEEEECNGT